MHAVHDPLGFVAAVLVFQMIPGPGSLAILRATARHGTRAGFAAVGGTLLGGLFCMLAAASGLEAVVQQRPEALHALQMAGSAYLAWLGWRLLRRQHASQSAAGESAPTAGRQLRQALAVSLSNPKVLFFYFALLPLFFRGPLDAAALATMIGCVSGISLAWQSALVLAGQAAARRLATAPRARRLVQRLAGAALVAFAARLLLA